MGVLHEPAAACAIVRETKDAEWLRLWRNFQTSDHLYCMFTKGGGPGEVHSYFSPFESPLNAYVAAQTSIMDLEARLRLATLTSNEPFLFCRGAGDDNFTGIIAWSLKGFLKALENVSAEALEFHSRRGDFASWAEHSPQDEILQKELQTISSFNSKGEVLRRRLVIVVKKRFDEVSQQVRDGSRLS